MGTAARIYGPKVLNYYSKTWKLGALSAGADLASQLQFAIPQSQVTGDNIGNYINISSPLAKFVFPANPVASNYLGQGLRFSVKGEYQGFGSGRNPYLIARDIGLGIGSDYLGGFLGYRFSPVGDYTRYFLGDYFGNNAANLIQLMWDSYYKYYNYHP